MCRQLVESTRGSAECAAPGPTRPGPAQPTEAPDVHGSHLGWGLQRVEAKLTGDVVCILHHLCNTGRRYFTCCIKYGFPKKNPVIFSFIGENYLSISINMSLFISPLKVQNSHIIYSYETSMLFMYSNHLMN